jgi:hypothetical protein
MSCNCFKWGRERVGEAGGDVTKVQYKAIQNCHHVSLLYNEYIIIKIENKINVSQLQTKKSTF